jgi:hypothetical protein
MPPSWHWLRYKDDKLTERKTEEMKYIQNCFNGSTQLLYHLQIAL